MHRWAVHQQQQLADGHDRAVHPRHQAQRGRPGPARRRRGRRGVLAALRRGVRVAAADARDVDLPTAHLVWQTLVGIGDVSEERLRGYLTKAMRESKQRTSWLDPDPEYEARVLDLATDALGAGHLAALVRTAVDHNAEAVRALVLGQKLLQLTAARRPRHLPGLRARRPLAGRPRQPAPGGLRRAPRPARPPRARAGAPRPRRREAAGHPQGADPAARPARELRRRGRLPAAGRARRGTSSGSSAAARSPCSSPAPTGGSTSSGGWDDATFALPEGLWRDELTGALHGGAENSCADVLSDYPVALLRRVHMR